MKKIIISGDLLRGTQDLSIKSFYNLFMPAIRRACPDILVERQSEFDRDKFFSFFNLCPSEETWVKLFYIDKIPAEAIDYINKKFADSVVIFVEAPLIFLKMFDLLNITYIDLTIHPIRYMDDLLLGFKTNNRKVYDKLLCYQINEYYFELYAGLLKASFQRRLLDDNIEPNSAIFFGQTPVDRSLLNSDGSIVTILNYKEEFEKLGTTHTKVYYKPHPLVGKNDNAMEYVKHLRFVEIIPANARNTYDLFASDKIKTVSALSSGCLYEGKFFNKEVKYLFKQPFHFAEEFDYAQNPEILDINETYVSIYKEYFSPHFWADILSDMLPVAGKTYKLPIEQLHNKLRYTLNSRWGYKDIQSVFIDEEVYGAKFKTKNMSKEKLKQLARKVLPQFVMNTYHKARYGSENFSPTNKS